MITDTKVLGVSETLARLRRIPLDGRVAVEVREKSLPGRQFLDFARRIADTVRDRGAALTVNDRIDIALAVGANCIHLPADSLPVDAARRLIPVVVGKSVHSVDEIENSNADYLRFGPVFDTPSKAAFGPAQGLGALRAAVRAAGKRPVLAVGGISTTRVPDVLSAGASGVAVIRAWLTADDPCRWVEDTLRAIDYSSTVK